jgi:hypothetical protein
LIRSGREIPPIPGAAVVAEVRRVADPAHSGPMTTVGARPRGGSGSEVTCGHCAHVDQLVAVSAVVAQGMSSSAVRGYVRNQWGGRSRVSARAVSADAVALMLSPPRVRTPVWPAIGAGASGFFGLVALQVGATGGAGAAFVGLVSFGCATVCGIVLWRRCRPAARGIAEGALTLWRRCWYCRRCGGVTLRQPDGPAVRLAAQGLAAELRSIAARELGAVRR